MVKMAQTFASQTTTLPKLHVKYFTDKYKRQQFIKKILCFYSVACLVSTCLFSEGASLEATSESSLPVSETLFSPSSTSPSAASPSAVSLSSCFKPKRRSRFSSCFFKRWSSFFLLSLRNGFDKVASYSHVKYLFNVQTLCQNRASFIELTGLQFSSELLLKAR
jgi:hypothetical protein